MAQHDYSGRLQYSPAQSYCDVPIQGFKIPKVAGYKTDKSKHQRLGSNSGFSDMADLVNAKEFSLSSTQFAKSRNHHQRLQSKDELAAESTRLDSNGHS